MTLLAERLINVDAKIKQLALELIHCEKEQDTIEILKKYGYWDDPKAWKLFGDNENNFSVIGSQQNSPDTALVEKLINSVDAVLMYACIKNGIAPDSDQAPQNITQAVESFFHVKDGKLSNLTSTERTELAQNIHLVATGRKTNPNYLIIDKGEGQTPETMPDTFLSINKQNKLRVQFVQGKFNMGGTGVLQFCGNHNLQLILSKKCKEWSGKDISKDYWGLTIVRRENPSNKRKSSTYTYLAPDGKILRFKADALNLLPDNDIPYKKPLKWGTFIKLYEYKMKGMLTNILFDLYNRLSLLMPGIALPIRLSECRGYQGHSLQTTLSGLNVRLEEDKRDNLEDGFPDSSIIRVNGQSMTASIYAFKEGQDTKYRRNEGVLFVLNGQIHGDLPKAFLSRNSVDKGYIADSILVMVDCSDIDGRQREDLFMNSRDRLRNGDFKSALEKELELLLSAHPKLRSLQEERKRKALENKLDNSKPLADVLKKVIKQSPTLSKLFIAGERLPNPFKLQKAREKETYEGNFFPTYFKIKKSIHDEILTKEQPKNMRFRIQYETDVNNDYFNRVTRPGSFKLFMGGVEVENYILNLHDGLATLTGTLPTDCFVGNVYDYTTTVSDETLIEPFVDSFRIIVCKAVDNTSGKKGKRNKAAGEIGKGNRETSASLDIPPLFEVRENEWDQYGFTRESALKSIYDNESGYSFYVNVDNIHLNTELKSKNGMENSQYIKSVYMYGMALLGISILDFFEKHPDEEDDFDVGIEVSKISEMISPVLIPMISVLGSLDKN